MIRDTFELLLGVIKSIGKDFEVGSFIAIWKAFCGSPNKNILLSWLYVRKENGRIFLNYCLNEKLKKYILENLWKK